MQDIESLKNTVLLGDVRQVASQIPDGLIQSIITSPLILVIENIRNKIPLKVN